MARLRALSVTAHQSIARIMSVAKLDLAEMEGDVIKVGVVQC